MNLCDSCETVGHCYRNGCIPLVTTNNNGRRVDTARDEAPRAQMPITFADAEGTLADDRPSMLASRWFWIAAFASLGVLLALADWALSVFRP